MCLFTVITGTNVEFPAGNSRGWLALRSNHPVGVMELPRIDSERRMRICPQEKRLKT